MSVKATIQMHINNSLKSSTKCIVRLRSALWYAQEESQMYELVHGLGDRTARAFQSRRPLLVQLGSAYVRKVEEGS